jgi:hypothetical protein
MHIQCPQRSASDACRTTKDGLAILSRVLTFVCFVVPNDTSNRGTRSAVTSHVARNAADYCTFNASLSICGSARSCGELPRRAKQREFSLWIS